MAARHREFARPDALRQSLRELRHRLLAVRHDKLLERREKRGMREAIAFDPGQNGLGESLGHVAERFTAFVCAIGILEGYEIVWSVMLRAH